jgi:Exocyst complex component Sec3
MMPAAKENPKKPVDVDEVDVDEVEDDEEYHGTGNFGMDSRHAHRHHHEDNPAVNAAKANHIASSAGTQRLNRIMRNTAIPDAAAAGRNFLGTTETKVHRVERVSNPHNLNSVAKFVERIVCPPLKVDSRSIGGEHDIYPEHKMMQETLLCFKLHGFETSGSTETVHMASLERPAEYAKHKRGLGFFGVGGAGKGTNRNKLRYVLIVRSTNAPLMQERKQEQAQNQSEALRKESLEAEENRNRDAEKDDVGYDTMYSPDSAGPTGTSTRHTSISHLNSSMREGDVTEHDIDGSLREQDYGVGGLGGQDASERGAGDDGDNDANPMLPSKGVGFAADTAPGADDFEFEISSFPVLVCMTLYSDGTNPDIRKLVPLSQLTSIQDLQTTVLQLGFLNGDSVRLDFGEHNEKKGTHGTAAKESTMDEAQAIEGSMQKERFIWSLLQIHAMLCVTVVEAYSLRMENTENQQGPNAPIKKDTAAVSLPPLNVRNVDKAELQYVATVNGFLKLSPTVCVLLDRQRLLAEDMRRDASDVGAGTGSTLLTSRSTPLIDDGISNKGKSDDAEEIAKRKPALEDMDNLAYDLMMGNFATRVAIFHSDEERKDAEAVLNSTQWTSSLNSEDTAAASAAERLGMVLQRRMRDLEAETCRRLIAWEDEKHYSVSSSSLSSKTANRDSVDALSLASLFNTLDALDKELQNMEHWLGERAAAIKPMTDDCRDIEEENRQLEQQWKSYDMLGGEMRRLLKGLEIQDELDKVLKNPASALVYDKEGRIEVDESQDGVDNIHEAGRALQDAMLHVQKSGGLHLKAVIERSDALEKTAASFCTALAQIIVTVMEQFKTDVVAGSDYGKVSKSDTHTMIAKKIRDTQRKFQSSLLGYIKLIEILADLSPELLPAVRDAYSEMVAEGIMMKKRMKGYFQALPGKNAAYLKNVSRDLKEYSPKFKTEGEDGESGTPLVKEDTVHADDIRYALSELLPVIAREAYFTAALFGLSNKAQDGRDKKRNFEAAKKSVDHSSQYFNYYIQRTCGVIQDFDPEAAANNPNASKGDPMLCLVASIHLNEAMENYIDREKKGGDHSLSLAYVRATILELRKKVDKQWVSWVERQIDWIRTHPGVPANGKRAGVIPSFGRFPVYLDHILLCCREGRKENYTPDFANIKVVSYYLQKISIALLESLRECAERESTEKQYAANVLQMENTYYFTQCIKERGPEMSVLFRKPIVRANATCKQSTDAYLGWMIKREFVVLHDLFSRISKTRREAGDKEVLQQVPKTMFVKTLQKEASREVMKDKIGVMYARMGKHLSEEGGLLPVAWKALVKVLYEWFGRWEKLSSQCYQHKLDPSAVDIVRIAKAAGNASAVTAVGASASGANANKKSILSR